MTPDQFQNFSRRSLFQHTGTGLGSIALASLLQEDLLGRTSVGMHHPAKAKNVIYFHFVGAPSHLDLFEWKPELQKRDGQLCPDEFFKGKRLAFIRKQPKLLGTQKSDKFKFQRCGQSGAYISSYCLSCRKKQTSYVSFARCRRIISIMHPLSSFFPLVSANLVVLALALGSTMVSVRQIGICLEYVTLVTGQYPGAGNSIFGSGFLPSVYQGVEFRSQGDPVLFLSNPKGIDGNARRRTIDAINQLNQDSLADVGDPEIATRISQYEMAYRMQSSVPELMDLSMESKSTLELYGASSNGASFANNCLLARRMVERGVRFVHLFDQGWDHHGSVFKRLPSKATQVDKPIAALLTDLRQRGLLDDTLVVWGAEFGRTPMAQDDGRDHHKEGFTLWMAGGGVKGGHSIGQTDELGYKPTQSPVHVHDFNATILHLLGIDHERLTYKFQGRKFRLTDVHGHVQHQLLA